MFSNTTRLPRAAKIGKPSSYLRKANWTAAASMLRLTDRQRFIVECLIDGKSEAAIARPLKLAAGTVHIAIDRLYKQFGLHDRTSLIVHVLIAHMICERKANRSNC